MKRILLLTSCLLAASPALAQQNTIAPSSAYQECTELSSSNPAQALIKADAWLKIDTGVAAQHCRAMALFGLRRFAEAGESLAAVRGAIGLENYSLRSYIARQAARAWMNANEADKALDMLSKQVAEMNSVRGDNVASAKLTSELLLERARLNATYGKFDEATKDLDHAVSLTPINEEVLLERATVFEKLGDKSLARNDAEIVLKLNSKNPDAKELLTRIGAMPVPAANLSAPASPAALMAPARGGAQPVQLEAPKPAKRKPAPKKVTPASEAP